MNQISTARPIKIGTALQFIFSFLFIVPVLLTRLDEYPPPFLDEGLTTNAARTLAERGVYGTYTIEGVNPFDPAVTTGPPVILLIAVLYKVIGTGISEPRFVITFYSILTIIGFYGLSRYLYGKRIAFLTLLLILATPPIGQTNFILMSRQVLGEIPALALISLGLWMWFISWERGAWTWGLVAGLALGLGLIVKLQTMLLILPAITIVGIARSWGKKTRLKILYLLPVMLSLIIALGWIIVQRIGYTNQFQIENSRASAEAILLLLFPMFWQRALTRGALFILFLFCLAVVYTTWRLYRERSSSRLISDRAWAELTVLLIVIFAGVWYGLFSIGWPRYSFIGLMIAYILLGKMTWDFMDLLSSRLGIEKTDNRKWDLQLIFSLFVIIAVILQGFYTLTRPSEDWASQTAEYISTHIPHDSVIESWAWEIDAASMHWKYHHPPQELLLLATRQKFLGDGKFELDYNALQANPDYIVMNTFSDWTQIYDKQEIHSRFSSLIKIGPYEIFERDIGGSVQSVGVEG